MFGAPCIGMAVAVTLRPIWSGFDAAGSIALASAFVAGGSLIVAIWTGSEQRKAARTTILDARLAMYLQRYSTLEPQLRGGINQPHRAYTRLSSPKRTQLQLVFASLALVLDAMANLNSEQFDEWQNYLTAFEGPLLDPCFNELAYAQHPKTKAAINKAKAAVQAGSSEVTH